MNSLHCYIDMYSYAYGDQNDNETISWRHFFSSHPDPEWQRIIHFARILTTELMMILILVVVYGYIHLSTKNVQAFIVKPVDDNVQSVLIPTTAPSQTPAPAKQRIQIEPYGWQPNSNQTELAALPPSVLGSADVALPENAKPLKDKYIIALYGDSMVDTMGEVGEYPEHALKKLYPNTHFLIYNYGVGSQNARDGLNRFYKRLDYQSRHYPPITDIHADIIVMGSFAYNVFSPHDRNQHWLDLTRLVQAAQTTGADVYMLAEIAPLRNSFGKGPHGVNWETDTVYKQSGNIIQQLENVIGLSSTLKVPLIDAYTPSRVDDGRDEGKKEYVNPDDNIHPSVVGHEFMAELIAKTIELK